jgi:hypothetical protein
MYIKEIIIIFHIFALDVRFSKKTKNLQPQKVWNNYFAYATLSALFYIRHINAILFISTRLHEQLFQICMN